MAELNKSPSKKNSQRLPAPTLFVGPPSRNASQSSLQHQLTTTTSSSRPGFTRQRSLLGDAPRSTTKDTNEPLTPLSATLGPFTRRQQQQQQLQAGEQRNNARTDTLWAEMQNTLEEVELNAANGAKLFGPNHTAALEQLRAAQIALAQAWTRTEADGDAHAAAPGNQPAQKPFATADVLMQGQPSRTAGKTRARSGTGGSQTSVKSQLEEETETDVEMARQRREANDRYFLRVESGVKDVVEKLEAVAARMKIVERETRELWGEESVEGSLAGSVT